MPYLLKHHASTGVTLPVAAFPNALQGSFSFFACGYLPMQDLCLVFSAPDGTEVRRVYPRRMPPRDKKRASRLRSYAGVLLLEYVVRRLLRQNLICYVDLGPEQLRYPTLSVRVKNMGKSAIVVGRLRLRTTDLGRDRL